MKRFLIILLLAFSAASACAAINLPGVFGDGMVLQRDQVVPIWGTAEPNEAVVVTFAGQSKSTVADARGDWRVDLDPLPTHAAGRPLQVGTRTFDDVLVGEVWLCSGQSNMWWPLKRTSSAAKEMPQATHPTLRLFHMMGAKSPGAGALSHEQLQRFNADDFFTAAWAACTPERAAGFSGVAYYFGKQLMESLDVPVGIICNAVGGSPTEAWMSKQTLEADAETAALLENWFENPKVHGFCRSRAKSNLAKWYADPKGERPRHPFEPHALFEYGIAPLVPFAIRGAVWYQGESNAPIDGTPFDYDVALQGKLFRGLIADWRAQWQSEFPFYFVQLPDLNRDWPAYREMQRQTLVSVPNTGMAVTLGLGHPTNVHPKNKRDVGQRLANIALHDTYGQTEIAPYGPMFSGHQRRGHHVDLSFDHAEEMRGGKGFEVAGTDGVFIAGNAEIVGDTVVVSAPTVANPYRVRYAWAPIPDGDLTNRSGLPTSPFEVVVMPLAEKNDSNVLFIAVDDLRTDTHRDTERREGDHVIARELYDHQRDPLETKKVIDDPAAQSAVEYCTLQLKQINVIEPGQAVPVIQVKSPGSFEHSKPGEFVNLMTPIGRLEVTAGKAEIDPKHAHDGSQCLHLLGGELTTVVWEPLEITPGALHFWAERWTSRAPFMFRIDAEVGGAWNEIYNGDKTIRVGRAFLNEVKIGLPAGVTRLRLRCSSPEKTGILIDELSVRPAKKMKVLSATCRQVITPVLIGKENNPVLELKIETEGLLEPLKLDGVAFQYTGTLPISDITVVRLLSSSGEVISETAPKNKVLLTTKHLLSSELSRFRVAVTLKDTADWNKTVDFALAAMSVGGHTQNRGVEHTDPAGASRIGVALRTRGQDGIVSYRIPGIATTSKGTIVAVYDNRNRAGGDLPGDIDVGMSRSTDGGRTWESMKVIMDMGNDPKWRYDGVGDPTILVDTNSDTLWVLATWSHGNRSWHGSGPGLTPEETGQLMLVKSEDDGKTWSKERNLTMELKDPSWNFLLQGPGNGITLADGTLVMPAQYKDSKAMPFSTIVYSVDQGETWTIGTGVKSDTTEAQVVQLANGEIMINCRDNRGGSRSVYTTSDLGATWKVHPTSRHALPEPVCNAGLLRVDELLFFSNPPQTRGRHNMTVKVSEDMGMTWPESMHTLIDEFHGAYSVMTPIDDEHIGLLYEGPGELYFVRLSIEELMRKKKASARQTDKPNILLIVSEDNGPELGCYGDPYVQTPVLDRLAASGTLFENAHVPYSVCSPSRAVFLTGLYPQQNGHLGLATHKFALFEKGPNVFSYLQDAGYFTGLIGKLHVNPESAFLPHIDYRKIPGANFGRRNMAEYAEAAAGLFDQAGAKPFFLSINYPDAHYPLHRQQFGLPEKPLSGKDVKPLPWVGGDSPRLREFTADYYNCLSRLDSGVGMLLEKLAESGRADNTIVIYMGDHGAQFSRGKCSVYEAGTRIPLLVKGVSGGPAGLRRTELVSTVDLLPTVLRQAGLMIPTRLPGRDLTPLMQGESPEWREYLSHITTGASPGLSYLQFSIRDARWKMIYSPRGQGECRYARAYLEQYNAHFAGGTRPEEIQRAEVYERFLNPPEFELYDLEKDPHEFLDLAEKGEGRTALARLQSALIGWQKAHGDPMIDPENVAFFVQEQADAIDTDYRSNKSHRWGYLSRFHEWRKSLGQQSP